MRTRRCRELPDRGQLVGLRARRTGEAIRAVGDALEAPDLAGVGESVPADAEALCLGSGEDALRCRELVDGCYVVRMLHVAIVRKFQTFATSKRHTPTMRLKQGQSKGATPR